MREWGRQMGNKILEVKNLSKEFADKHTSVKAVSDVSFHINKGETFGIVGESGCGKTTLGRCIVRGIDVTDGEVLIHDEENVFDFLQLGRKELRNRRKEIQMIFQDPYSSLDPRMTVYDIISEPLKANYKLSKEEMDTKVKDMAEKTGLNISFLKRYPHAFSGGQRQRIGIARALITSPRLIVCDEAVSALDVSIQAQIINLLKSLQEDYNYTYIFISHDLSVVEHISDRVGVMYLGKMVEVASTEELFNSPKHPYTEALLSAVPKPDPDDLGKRITLEGEVPNPADPPSGCHFHPRCPYKRDICTQEIPSLNEEITGHHVACHFADQLKLDGI